MKTTITNYIANYITKFLLLTTIFCLQISPKLLAQTASSTASNPISSTVSNANSSIISSTNNSSTAPISSLVTSSATSSTIPALPAIPLTISQTGLASSQGQMIFDVIIKNPNSATVTGFVGNFVSTNSEIIKVECSIIGVGSCLSSNLKTDFELDAQSTLRLKVKAQADLTGKYCHNATLNYSTAIIKANQSCVDAVVKNDIKVSQKTEYTNGILTWTHTIQNFGVAKDLTFIDYFPKNYQMDSSNCAGSQCFDYLVENGIYYQSISAKADETVVIKISGKPKVMGNYCNTSQLYYFDNIIETNGDCVKYPENLPADLTQINQIISNETLQNPATVSDPKPIPNPAINPTIFDATKKGKKDLVLVRTGGNNQYLILLIFPILITVLTFVFLKKKENKASK